MRPDVELTIVALGTDGVLPENDFNTLQKHFSEEHTDVTLLVCGTFEDGVAGNSYTTAISLFSKRKDRLKTHCRACFNNQPSAADISRAVLVMNIGDIDFSDGWKQTESCYKELLDVTNTRSKARIVVVVSCLIMNGLAIMWPSLEVADQKFFLPGDLLTVTNEASPKNGKIVRMSELNAIVTA